MVNEIWADHFGGWKHHGSVPGPKPKTSFKHQLRVVLLDLYVAWLENPYALPDGLLPGTPPELQRALVKHLVLTALNAKDRKSAFQSFQENWPAGHFGKLMTNDDMAALLTAFTMKHPHLKDYVCADQGIRLMNVDGRIAALVHRHFTAQGVPGLSVHDSFIINYTNVGELKRVMAEASEAVVGRPLPVSTDALGLDEIEAEHRADFAWWRQAPRSEGYMSRMKGGG